MTERICQNRHCGKPLVRRATEKPFKFNLRAVCNAACASARKAKDLSAWEGRACCNPACGKVLIRKPREDAGDFIRRRTCNYSCAAQSLAREPVFKPPPPPAPPPQPVPIFEDFTLRQRPVALADYPAFR